MTPRDRSSVRLNSLELQGYKTFATKTEFQFAPTITAIVGPNGSGKSNIADAIRWVLGEQAYSLLRGKKTEDMIFSGSESRSRAGMASATITFDNSQGWLPIDFSEVTVGRRAYRDGQNEYLVNGQKVRLRDVSELLAESGLSERTYTVIGQGLVDAALSLRAEERRELFEEAAGIGLYRSRREEAVRRLESTRRNLDRVQDILAELRPRLRSLERQAQRAQDYRQVKEDLRSSLRVLYGYHWNRMQASVSAARRVALEQHKQREILQEKQRTVDEKLQGVRAQIATLRESLQDWSGEASGLYERREQLGRRVAVTKERIRWLREQREMMLSEVDSLETEMATEAKAVEVTREEHQQLEEEVRRYEGAVTDDGEGMSLRDRRELQEEIEGGRRQLEALAGREAAWSTADTQLQQRRADIKERLLEVRGSRAEAEEQLDQLESQVEGVRAARRRLEEIQARLSEQGAEIRRQIEETERALQVKRRQQAQAEAQLARLESRMAALREMAEGPQAGARSLLAAAEKGQIRGIVGRVANDVQVKRGFREAVLTALGERLGGLALRSQEDLEAALSILEGQPEKGRTVLLSLDGKRQGTRLEPPQRAGVLGNAADYVEGRSQLARTVKMLLSRTWIVEDRGVALELREEGDDGAQLVTEAGELFQPDGTVVVGPPYLGPGRAERDSLEAEKGQLEDRLQGLAEAIEELEAGLVEREAREGELEEALARRQREREEASEQLQSLELQRQQASARLEAVREREVNLEEEQEAVRQRQRELSEEGEAFEEKRAQLERSLQNLRRQVELVAGGGESELRGEWQASRRAKKEAESRLKERTSRLERLEEELGEWKGRLAATEAEIEEKKAELADLEARAEEVEAAIGERQGAIDPAEIELTEAEARRSELESEESQLRLELQAAENRHSQAQVELARREEEMHGLQRRIEDDFGLVAYEYDEETTGQEPLPLEGLVEKLPVVEERPEGLETQVKRQRAQLRRMGSINPEAQEEYTHVKERVAFMTSQVDDLREAETKIQEVIAELDVIMAREFRKTFDAVASAFRETFKRLFDGGSARLALSDPDDPNESGIEIEARLPGRREQGLAVLSGGERSLTASALVFALLKVSPTPFCVLDEVDAMLDEANVGRFCELLQELSEQTQFIVITHNRLTVQAAQAVYGVSMSADSTSKLISLDLDEAAREVAA